MTTTNTAHDTIVSPTDEPEASPSRDGKVQSGGSWSKQEGWLAMLRQLLKMRPLSETNFVGVDQASCFIEQLLKERGFQVKRIVNPAKTDSGIHDDADILVATRAPRFARPRSGDAPPDADGCICLFGHLDVDSINSPEEWITGDPFEPTI